MKNNTLDKISERINQDINKFDDQMGGFNDDIEKIRNKASQIGEQLARLSRLKPGTKITEEDRRLIQQVNDRCEKLGDRAELLGQNFQQLQNILQNIDRNFEKLEEEMEALDNADNTDQERRENIEVSRARFEEIVAIFYSQPSQEGYKYISILVKTFCSSINVLRNDFEEANQVEVGHVFYLMTAFQFLFMIVNPGIELPGITRLGIDKKI